MNCLLRLFVSLALLPLIVKCSNSTLRLVNLVYRHGDRSPVLIFPTDPNKEDKWPEGLGWLSTLGMHQQFSLGQWLRHRYIDTGFMSAAYEHEQIRIMSSDEDRTLMSAYSNLAGLYPPTGDQVWNANITWQPIPVHTKPRSEDNMLNLGENCPEYNKLLQDTYRSSDVIAEETKNKEFYEWLGVKSGWKPQNISNVWKVTDTLKCEKAHNLTVAPWVNDTVYSLLQKLDNYQFTLMYNSVEKSRLMGGPLLREYILKMQERVKYDNMTEKMFMYSGHDTTVAALLSALGVYDDLSPPYAATVIAELHEAPTGHFYVNLFYKNSSDMAAPLVIPNCSFNCSLDDFVRLTKPVIPVDWLAECRLGDGRSGRIHLSTAWIVAIGVGGLLAVVLVVGLVCVIKRRRANRAAYGKFGTLN